MEEKNFGYLGFSFQQSLIKAIIEDKKYGETIVDVLESKYFDNSAFKYIMENIKELYKAYNKIPNYDTIQQKIMAEGGNSTTSISHVDTIKTLSELSMDYEYVKDTALNFCKQQNLKRELKSVQTIIENGNFEEYNKIEQIIQKALQVGIQSEEGTDVFHDMESALEKDNRHPIPLGIVGIDNLLEGGLGRGELGVVLAPTGTGKTTLLTKFANTAYNLDYNVLQIFFEDNPGNIKRKHYTIWSEISPKDQPEFKEEVMKKVEDAQKRSKGSIRLLKLPSDNVTISEIKSKMRKMISDGFKIDLLIIDYVDCISPERTNFGEEWNLSIAKTLEQKEHNLATLTLLKSRIGRDGVVFQNCKFNNEFLFIDTETQNTLLGYEEQKVQERANRAQEVYRKAQEKKQLIK